MVRLTVLASGSKGNSSVISSGRTKVLVDVGLSCRETLKRMHCAGEDPECLDAILITHEHQDHVNGLAVLARKLRIPVYMTGATHQGWRRWMRSQPAGKEDPTKASLQRHETFEAGRCFSVGDIEVLPFTTPHDAADPVGFVFSVEGCRLGYLTDLGYLPANVKHYLRGCDGLLIESNHDKEMLRNGPYPWSVKQRVASRDGHLANEDLAAFFQTDYDGGAAFIVLAHLSENNNHPELARKTAEEALGPRRNLLHANRVYLASQADGLAPLTL
jgi:phosphoribosyl 1,2-cyclic phosphodiesterase